MDPSESTDSRLRPIGTASSSDPGAAIEHLEAARSVRRALADAGRKARDVTAIAVSTDLAATQEEGSAFSRLALGPHGDAVVVLLVKGEEVGMALATALDPTQLGITVVRAGSVARAVVWERRTD